MTALLRTMKGKREWKLSEHEETAADLIRKARFEPNPVIAIVRLI